MMGRLALADARHEWKMFVCYAIALSAVLAPLLVLYGLKFGVVTALTRQLLDDPSTREIIVIGNRSYDREWLDDLAARADVGFLAPRTRSIAASIHVSTEPGARSGLESAELVPSGPGDPLLDPMMPSLTGNQVALSQMLAARLDVEPGDTIGAAAMRQVEGLNERVDLELQVVQVLPPGRLQRRAVLAPLPLLEAVEDFRDGLAVPAYGWPGEPRGDEPRPYASFRLYAADLDGVAGLGAALIDEGLEIRSAVGQIESVRSLDRSLTQIFSIIAALGGVGYLLSLGANLWSNVERKQRDLSIIRLLGFSSGAMIRFPIIQALAISIAGLALAFSFYYGAEQLINALFSAPGLEGQRVCVLLPSHFGIAAAGTLISAALAAAAAGWQASRVEPAEGMRDV